MIGGVGETDVRKELNEMAKKAYQCIMANSKMAY